MQAIVERVIRALAFKKPPFTKNLSGDRQTPAELAADLLVNYRTQLMQRARPPQSRWPASIQVLHSSLHIHVRTPMAAIPVRAMLAMTCACVYARTDWLFREA